MCTVIAATVQYFKYSPNVGSWEAQNTSNQVIMDLSDSKKIILNHDDSYIHASEAPQGEWPALQQQHDIVRKLDFRI